MMQKKWIIVLAATTATWGLAATSTGTPRTGTGTGTGTVQGNSGSSQTTVNSGTVNTDTRTDISGSSTGITSSSDRLGTSDTGGLSQRMESSMTKRRNEINTGPEIDTSIDVDRGTRLSDRNNNVKPGTGVVVVPPVVAPPASQPAVSGAGTSTNTNTVTGDNTTAATQFSTNADNVVNPATRPGVIGTVATPMDQGTRSAGASSNTQTNVGANNSAGVGVGTDFWVNTPNAANAAGTIDGSSMISGLSTTGIDSSRTTAGVPSGTSVNTGGTNLRSGTSGTVIGGSSLDSSAITAGSELRPTTLPATQPTTKPAGRNQQNSTGVIGGATERMR